MDGDMDGDEERGVAKKSERIGEDEELGVEEEKRRSEPSMKSWRCEMSRLGSSMQDCGAVVCPAPTPSPNV